MENPSSTVPNTYSNTASDEISLRELFTILWDGRKLIASVTSIVFCIAAAYVFITPTIYEVQVETLPPPESGLIAYNSNWRLATGNPTTTTTTTTTTTINAVDMQKAYTVYFRHLTSSALRQHFFESVYLPTHARQNNAGLAEQNFEKDTLWRRFDKELTIKKIKDSDRITLTFRGKNARTITDWANQYTQEAIALAQHELFNNLENERQQRIRELDEKIDALRIVTEANKQDRIVALKESLALANSIGLETASSTGDFITPYARDTMYLRGARALQAEIDVLERRKNNDPFISGLPDFLEHKRLLENIKLPSRQISVAQIDLPASVPIESVQPQKALILVLSVIFGGVLGMLTVGVRRMWKTADIHA